MNTAKKIVENVLGPSTTKKLWSSVYLPALPFTPQLYSMGAILPAILYMFRWGHRRGSGTFVKTFGQAVGDKINAPTIEDVTTGLLKRNNWFSGFDSTVETAILGDMLLSFCLENKNHLTGRNEQVQRAYPTHYLSSWIDLPKTLAWLRNIPEMLVVLLANQDEGNFIIRNDGKSYFSVDSGFEGNVLLKLFGAGMRIKGDFRSNLTSDEFIESQEGNISVGIDQLLTIRMAQSCGEAPVKAKGSGESEKILNQHPLAKKAAKLFREDLSVFIQAYGETIPRQAFLQMLESCLSLGLTNIYLSTAKMLLEWEHTGALPDNEKQISWPLFVDCSSGNDTNLRKLSEQSTSDLFFRFERVPIIMMCMRVLDYQVRNDRKIREDLPSNLPESDSFINLLGAVYTGRHPNAVRILDKLDEECFKLSDALFEEKEEPLVQELLRQNINPAMRLAEALCLLMGDKLQISFYISALNSCLMVGQPNGLASKRKVQLKDRTGKTIRGDARSIILTNPMLDFIVHRHLRKAAKGKGQRSLAFIDLLKLLKDRYGLYVDEAPPGMSISARLLDENKEILERRLRDLGVFIGVNDAESMKRLQQRFKAKGDGDDE